jgi:hypothetical protein
MLQAGYGRDVPGRRSGSPELGSHCFAKKEARARPGFPWQTGRFGGR